MHQLAAISMTLDLSAYTLHGESTAVSGHAAICLPLRRGAVCLSTNTKPGRRFALAMLRVLSPLSRGILLVKPLTATHCQCAGHY